MDGLLEARSAYKKRLDAYLDDISAFSVLATFGDEERESFRDMLAYNLSGGKQIRGFTLYMTARDVAKATGTLNPSFDHEAAVASYAVEALQAAALMIDDIIDKGATRRNQPCWYTLPDVGMRTLWDFSRTVQESHLHLRAIVRSASRKLEGANPARVAREVMDVCMRGEVRSYVGVSLELYAMIDPISCIGLQPKIHANKTGYYTCFAPLHAGAVLGGLRLKDVTAAFGNPSVRLGEFFQELDDYLDCYACPEKVGKAGTDIQNNACTFLLRMALENASETDAEELRAHYGKWDLASVQAIKEIYRRLRIKDLCEDHIERTLTEVYAQPADDPAMQAIAETFNNFVLVLTHHYFTKKA